MPILYKVTSPTHVVSYLYGTIHRNEDKYCLFSAEAKLAFENANVLVCEQTREGTDQCRLQLLDKINLWRQAQADKGVKEIGGYLVYPELKKLIEVFGLGEVTFNKVKETIEVPPIMLCQQLIAQLYSPLQKDSYGSMYGAPPILDDALKLRAEELGKKCISLDTVDESLSYMLAEQITYDQQVEYWHEFFNGLMDLQKVKAEVAEKEQRITEIYLQGDLDELLKYYEQSGSTSGPIAQQYMAILIQQRNTLFAERLKPIFEKKEAFVGIGVMHLPGIVELLQANQFKVEPVVESKKEHFIRTFKNSNVEVDEELLIGRFNKSSSVLYLAAVEDWQKYNDLVRQGKIEPRKSIDFQMVEGVFSASADATITESDCVKISALLAQEKNASVSNMSLKFHDVSDDVLINLLSAMRAKKIPKLALDFTKKELSERMIEYLQEFVGYYNKNGILKTKISQASLDHVNQYYSQVRK